MFQIKIQFQHFYSLKFVWARAQPIPKPAERTKNGIIQINIYAWNGRDFLKITFATDNSNNNSNHDVEEEDEDVRQKRKEWKRSRKSIFIPSLAFQKEIHIANTMDYVWETWESTWMKMMRRWIGSRIGARKKAHTHRQPSEIREKGKRWEESGSERERETHTKKVKELLVEKTAECRLIEFVYLNLFIVSLVYVDFFLFRKIVQVSHFQMAWHPGK